MAFINRHNIENTLTLSMHIVALLPFSGDEDRCQMLKITQIRDLDNYNWYLTNASTLKDLGLDDKETVGFVYKDGDESRLRTFIQSSRNDNLQRICIRIKELNKICRL